MYNLFNVETYYKINTTFGILKLVLFLHASCYCFSIKFIFTLLFVLCEKADKKTSFFLELNLNLVHK